MKKTFIFLFIAIASVVLVGCKEKVIREYYEVSIERPIVETDDFGNYKVSKARPIEIKKIPSFNSDSAAIATWKKHIQEVENNLPKLCENQVSKVKREHANSEPYIVEELVKITREVYEELANTQYYLLAFSHTKDYNAKELFDIIKKYGLISSEVRDYVEKNKLEIMFEPLN